MRGSGLNRSARSGELISSVLIESKNPKRFFTNLLRQFADLNETIRRLTEDFSRKRFNRNIFLEIAIIEKNADYDVVR